MERAEYAGQQLELAEVGVPWASDGERKASGGCGVLAAIAAADAICCARLGRRSRGQDHGQATALLELVEPDGKSLSRDLETALAAKDLVHYGTALLSAERHLSLLRSARRLVAAAADAARRP